MFTGTFTLGKLGCVLGEGGVELQNVWNGVGVPVGVPLLCLIMGDMEGLLLLLGIPFGCGGP